MNHLNFSILIPTRDRPKFIRKRIQNIINTSYDMSQIDVLIAFDRDDKETHNELENIRSNKYSIYSISRDRSDHLNADYYNWLAGLSQGKYLWANGDDILINTKNWDKILKEKIDNYLIDKPDGIAYISVKEKNSQAKHPCFPLITRKSFETLNMYFHPELLTWGADRCLWELYNGVNRILHVPEVEIEHISYHDGKAPLDETARSVRERFFRDPDCHNKVCVNIIPKQIQLLKEIINGMVRK